MNSALAAISGDLEKAQQLLKNYMRQRDRLFISVLKNLRVDVDKIKDPFNLRIKRTGFQVEYYYINIYVFHRHCHIIYDCTSIDARGRPTAEIERNKICTCGSKDIHWEISLLLRKDGNISLGSKHRLAKVLINYTKRKVRIKKDAGELGLSKKNLSVATYHPAILW